MLALPEKATTRIGQLVTLTAEGIKTLKQLNFGKANLAFRIAFEDTTQLCALNAYHAFGFWLPKKIAFSTEWFMPALCSDISLEFVDEDIMYLLKEMAVGTYE